MKKIITLVGILILGLGAQCNNPVPPTSGYSCANSYAHLVSLNCTPKGDWINACENMRKSGLFSLKCIVDAQTKETAQAMCKVDCQ